MDMMMHLSFSTLLVIVLVAVLAGVLLGVAVARPHYDRYR